MQCDVQGMQRDVGSQFQGPQPAHALVPRAQAITCG